jgi:hypothetical protein
MEFKTLLEQRRKRLEKAAAALDLLSDPDIKAQLASDPEMRNAFVAAIGGSNGTQPALTGVGGERKLPPSGSQLRAVLDAAKNEPGDFTTKSLVEKMRAAGYRFEASEPQIAINSALKQLQARDFIALINQGRGRAASVFRYLKGQGE